ncbi:protein kinase domain-containing protein [Actinoplanes sp. CA-030573]|uniref:serine/threonine-protein kinase n=1 Tax=Actinoplanes sp. CA-030573 TaxID=3239898 RepID=UPI003D90C2BF
MLTTGTVLSERYRLTERIAAGGMGEVWRGTDMLLHRGVAIKVLLPTLMSDADFINRFRREARMMAALRHPGIVQVYDYGENAVVGGRRLDYLVMEFVDGTPLSKRIEAAGRLGVAETLQMVAQVADALQVAHEAGIVHRDVKPSNLLVRPGGALVLVDFGVARSATAQQLTSTGMVLGSAHYMAPEQAEGKPVTPVTDVYALGAVAYCCLTGRPPYVGEPLQVLTQLVTGKPPTLPADIPPPVAAVVLRALEKDPARRCPSAAALAAAARAALRTGPPPTRAAALRPPSASTGFPPAAAASPGFASPAGAQPGSSSAGGAPRPVFASASAPVSRPPAYASAAPVPAAFVPPAATTPPGGMPAAGGRRRTTTTIAVVVAAVFAIVVGISAVFALRPDRSVAQTEGQDPGLGIANGPADSGQNHAKPGPARSAAPVKTKPSRAATTTAPATTDPATDPAAGASAEPSGSASSGSAPATNPQTPKAVCGSEFAVIDQAPLKSAGVVRGRVYLMYNAATGKNCTVALKATDLGQATAASAYLEVQGQPRVTDAGAFEYYAGPVKAKADGVCVKWGGTIGDASYDSDFEHCAS